MTSGEDLDNSAHEERTVAQAFYNALVRDGLDILHEPERLRDALLAEAPDHPAMAVLRYNLDAELLAPYLEALGGNERPTEEELREAAGHAEVLLTEHRAIMQDAAHLATTQLSDGLATYLNVSATPAEENPAEQKAWYKSSSVHHVALSFLSLRCLPSSSRLESSTALHMRPYCLTAMVAQDLSSL